jgi:hypothetical protein
MVPPLSRANPPLEGGVDKVKNSPIIITQNIIDWMGYKGRNVADKQDHFLRLIQSLKVPYKEIDYKHPLAIEYPCIQTEAKIIPKQIEQKRWICMEPRAFKNVIMRLNTENADMIREYYLNLEEAMFDYGRYTAQYMMEKNNKQVQRLVMKDKAEIKLKKQLRREKERAEQAELEAEQEKNARIKTEKEAKEKLQRALKFNQATKQIEPQEYIYVVTTDNYSPENKFKPGGCETFKLLKSRLNTYNSGKSDSDSHYYVYVRKVVSYRSIEQALLGCLGGFRENVNKELYMIHFDWLVRCLDAIIDHTSEFLSFVNLNRDQMVEDTMNREPVIPPPIRLEKLKISYQRVGEEEVEVTTIFDQDTIDAIKESLTSFNPDNNTIKRTTFEDHLKHVHPEVKIDNKKRNLWEIVKQIGGSLNPSWRFKY